MTQDPLAPKNLGQAFGYIHDQIQQRKAKSNGHPIPKLNRCCDVCGKLWYHSQVIHSPELITKRCSDCDAAIADGMIAVRTIGGKYCFIRSESLAEHGPILEVSEEVFKEVEARAREQAESNKPPTEEQL